MPRSAPKGRTRKASTAAPTTPAHASTERAPRPAARRHQTRQRSELLACLRGCDAHPTAAELHAALLGSFPRLSLGTVYRNLEVLVQEGQIDAVPGESGALRYDGNPAPHHHFTCEDCGHIQDISIPAPRALGRQLRERYALQAHRIRIDFIGLCTSCGGTPQPDRSQPGRSTRHGTSEGQQDASEPEARVRR
jgi:Fe2+ or Zn2+ uptake regulation protein